MKVNRLEQEDILGVAKSNEIDWDKFQNKTIAVTGATGLVGKGIVRVLLQANKEYKLGCSVLAFVRNIEKAKQLFEDDDALNIIKQDVLLPVPEEIKADYLIHGASITASRMMVEQPVETIMTTIEGTRNMMEFAKRCEMDGVVYLSSMEAYGSFDANHGEVKEYDLGYVDLTNVRSSYPEGKRMAECLCTAYANEYHVNVKIARLAATFGAGISKDENRVFAQFAKSILNGEDIILHTKGDKANCYCYISDAVAALLLLLTRGESGQTYNVANMETFCSIREMAEIFLELDGTQKSQLRIEIPENLASLGYAPTSILKLNSEKLLALGWKPQKNMKDMAYRLLESMKCGDE